MFTTPQSNKECFRTELSVQSLTFLIISTFLVGHRDQAKASSDVIEDFLSFPPTAICTAAQKRNIKKQR